MNLRYKSLAHYRIKVVRPIQSFPKWARYLVLDKVRRLELPSSTLCMSLALVPPTHPTRLNGIRNTFLFFALQNWFHTSPGPWIDLLGWPSEEREALGIDNLLCCDLPLSLNYLMGKLRKPSRSLHFQAERQEERWHWHSTEFISLFILASFCSLFSEGMEFLSRIEYAACGTR